MQPLSYMYEHMCCFAFYWRTPDNIYMYIVIPGRLLLICILGGWAILYTVRFVSAKFVPYIVIKFIFMNGTSTYPPFYFQMEAPA